MVGLPQPLQQLIASLSRLPSIGEKSATRLACFLVNDETGVGQQLLDVLARAKGEIKLCNTCFYYSVKDSCQICESTSRDSKLLCIVEKPVDILAVERLGEYKGLYHVLHGLWAPLRGQGPEKMKLKELIDRVAGGGFEEIIIGTSPTVEGDATALYLAKILAENGIKFTRLAQGLPKGGELEYADDVTLSRAFSGRSVVNI